MSVSPNPDAAKPAMTILFHSGHNGRGPVICIVHPKKYSHGKDKPCHR
jgi:hypothetical protein